MAKEVYTKPTVTEYGSVESITENNKIGRGEDRYSDVGAVVGSLTPAP